MYQINLQPQEQQLEGSALLQLIEQWLDDQRLHLPPTTVDGYAVKLHYFVQWWERCGGAQGWKISRGTLAAFNRWLTDEARTKRGDYLSYHTRNDVLRRMKQMLRWAKAFDRIPVDLSDWVPTAEGSAPLRVAPDMDAVERLVAAAEAAGPRDAAILAVFLGTGVRRAEAAGLDVTDVTLFADLSGTLVVRRAKKVKNRVVQSRLVAFDAATGHYLSRWLDHLPPAGPLFPSSHVDRDGERLTPQGVYKVVRRIIYDAGLEHVIQGPHDLRRLFATTFARHRRGAGYDSLLSRQLGHSAYAMTAHYVLADVRDIADNLVTPLSLIGRGLDTA
jgi:integrase